MKVKYTIVHVVDGITLPTVEGGADSPVVQRQDLTAILTSEPDNHLQEADRHDALRTLMMQSMFGGRAKPADLEQRDLDAIRKQQEMRKERHKSGPFLIITVRGEVESFDSSQMRETEHYGVCFDGYPTEIIYEKFSPLVSAVISALRCAATTVSEVREIQRSVVFIRDDDKPVHSMSLSISGHLSISRQLTSQEVESASGLFDAFARDKSLERVHQLLALTLESRADCLRAFLSAWTALEVFTNKVFRQYEDEAFRVLERGSVGKVPEVFLARIRQVMRDKYGLRVKFAVISQRLSADSTAEDCAEFRKVKKVRDDLAHGTTISDKSLPTEAICDLLVKYLRCHSTGSSFAAP